MSEMSRQARRAARAKAHRIAKGDAGKVDASDYGPEENLGATAKTGMRPVSRRAYKSGGKVEGADAAKNAGKAPRKGNKPISANSYINRDAKEANDEREGEKHVGGLKRGGRASGGKATRGPGYNRDVSQVAEKLGLDRYTVKEASSRKKYADSRAHSLGNAKFNRSYSSKDATHNWIGTPMTDRMRDEHRNALKSTQKDMADLRAARGEMKSRGYKKGGKVEGWSEEAKDAAKKMTRGTYGSGVPKDGYSPARGLANRLQKEGPRYPDSEPSAWEEQMSRLPRSGGRRRAYDNPTGGRKITTEREYKKGGAVKRAGGGAAKHSDEAEDRKLIGKMVKKGALTGKKDGGRLERKSGGRAKGNTDINIIIGRPSPAPGAVPPVPGGLSGGAAPVPVGPPALGAVGAPIPAPGAAAGPVAAPQMPIGRKDGGRIHMTAGSRSGLGRLQKAAIAKRDREG